MKLIGVTGIFVSLLALIFISNRTLTQDKQPDPVKMFIDKKCTSCHSILVIGLMKTNEKSKAPDLSYSKGKTPEFLIKYLRKETEIDGKKHGISWSGSDNELKALVDWIVSIRQNKQK